MQYHVANTRYIIDLGLNYRVLFVVIFKLDSYFLLKLKGYFLYFTPIVHSMLKLRIHLS
jgi:hypothetical protein